MFSLDSTSLGFMLYVGVKYAMLLKIGAQCCNKRLVAKISRITLFPVKSMRGVEVKQAECTYTGLTANGFNDRCFMVTNGKYEFVSARMLSRLAEIITRIDGDTLHLSTSGTNHITIQIPTGAKSDQGTVTATVWEEEVEAIDCGDEVAEWLDATLNRSGLRLLHHTEGMQKRRCDLLDTPWHRQSSIHDQVSFQDGFPYMLMSKASVEELNTRIRKTVSINNFRPNIVVEACGPYDEDTWDKVYIGDAEFFNIKPCHRCIMTTVDPKSGQKDPNMEPLRTLKRYRLLPKDAPPFWTDNPTFGINLIAIRPGQVCVGDPVYATRKHNAY